MWWENFNAGSPPDARFDWCIEVMEETLKLPSEACCESALHGLGHEEDKVPETVHRIIDKFLAERSSVSPELRAYAARAREGAIQ
jgi:hypothetical protein